MKDSILYAQQLPSDFYPSEGVTSFFNESPSSSSQVRSPEASRVMAMLQQHDSTFFASLVREQDPSHHRLERLPSAKPLHTQVCVNQRRGLSKLATVASPLRPSQHAR
jgi:hypothetical protein